MENIIYLYGEDYEKDKERIESSIKQNPVFLLNNAQTELHQYIDYLHDELGLRSKILNKLKICREISFAGQVTLVSGDGVEFGKPRSMYVLLEQLQPGTRFRLVIENNSRPLLADIVQQLIYINYPITEIDVKLRSEYKDAAKTALFMEHIQTLQNAAKSAVDKLTELRIDPEADEATQEKLRNNQAQALASYQKICEQIAKAMDVEMKVAVAASKKTGKSVIVNCMLGVELAPTSLELATPNVCIYKRSSDRAFHLQMVGENGTLSPAEDFDSAKEMYQRISRVFKKAQSDAEAKFAAPDMQISYVSNGNNFESYTVYDTPGPDLAGAAHIAKKAIDECDVAIFAIDYTKYLTTSEEALLREIKTTFQEKHKFHTLIFVINKMDEALNDKGTKSRVKSIDLIRYKLREIDKQYGDCIVFATSARDFFYSVELEEAAERMNELSSLRDPEADLYQHLRPIKDSLESNECEDEGLINVLSTLDGDVGNIKSNLGYSKVNMETLRYFSGVPQLMDYVSYIAKSKARDEIVNSITHTIASQCRTLQVLIGQIANMDELMGKTQQEINKISGILDEYVAQVREILSEDLSREDRHILDPTGLLAGQIEAIHRKSGNTSRSVRLSEVLDEMCKGIADLDYEAMQRRLWNDFRPAYQNKIRSLVGKTVPKEALDMKSSEVREIIDNYIEREVRRRLDDEKENIEGLVKDLKAVIDGRLARIDVCSAECKQQLEKNACHLQLPEPLAFDAAIPEPKLDNRVNIYKKLQMSGQIDGIYKDIKGLKKFFRNVFVHGDLDYDKKEVKVKYELTDERAKQIQGPFYEMLADAHVYQSICQVLKELANGVKKAEKQVLECFDEMNVNCTTTIDTFKQGIDDRDYYKDKLADYIRVKNFIANIQDASKEFLDTWVLIQAE